MMDDVPTEPGSIVVLWGEEQENCNATNVDATNVGKPFEEQNKSTSEHGLDVEEENSCSSDSSIESDDKEKPYFDPVGSHLIELRKYYLYLEKELQKRAVLEESEISENNSTKRAENCDFAIPAFPLRYPFSPLEARSEDRSKLVEKFNKQLSEHQVKRKLVIFIKKVFEQVGVCGIEDEKLILDHLSYYIHIYLQKFVDYLKITKNSKKYSEDEGLLNSLETTLRKFGIEGFTALHIFYYENIAKKHDILLKKCMDICDQLQNQ